MSKVKDRGLFLGLFLFYRRLLFHIKRVILNSVDIVLNIRVFRLDTLVKTCAPIRYTEKSLIYQGIRERHLVRGAS